MDGAPVLLCLCLVESRQRQQQTMPFTNGLRQGVGDARHELEAVLLVAEGRVVEVVVQRVDAQAEALVDGHREPDVAEGGIRLEVVPGLDLGSALGYERLPRQAA